ncbi:hypothetical protein [Rhizobium chutanense]|uniref:Uncharacterized protein n=1 Tax=Rhizobium chutanense TaxID=2035448 RepID=A0A2A6JAB0_9HYPH|nr:hypothetical protein [Rhizobium chutanense]PDT02794.1 hypothetical protein CO666_18080 [Rhizobium chutanense]RUM03879.1 hypothetical protein EFR84_18010 [Rhizobium chutanense]
MAGHDDRYIEITTRLRSVRSFCDFLSQGATVRVALSDGTPYKDVTAVLLERNRREAEALDRMRRRLYPEFADEEVMPPLYSRH